MSEIKYKNGTKQRRPIDRWETLDVLYDERETLGRDTIGVRVEIQRPIFEGDQPGRVCLNCVVYRGDRNIRFFCRSGDMSEIIALQELLNGLTVDMLDEFADRYEALDTRYRSRRLESRREPRPGEVGGGLSRFSKPNKGEYQQRKRIGRQGRIDG